MNQDILKVKNGRIVCWILVIVDILLGGTAVFLPNLYADLVHPELTSPPIDLIMRTGVLWLIFALFQFIAATSKNPEKWFFAVGIIRLMEIPADILYGFLAIGSPLLSRLMILQAPVFNIIFGTYLYLLSKKLERESSKI